MQTMEKNMWWTKEDVIASIEENKLITILRGVPGEKLLAVAEAMYEGGIRLMEITYSADGKVPDAKVAGNIAMLAKHFAGRMLIGAGTVLNAEQVRLTKEAGGAFIISPNTDERVIKETNACGMISIPGALTPTEICQAHLYGADFVKLFPVSTMGPEYVKAVKAPLSHVRLLAVGGVDENNMATYLNAGACGFGIGSNIVDKKRIKEDDFAGITFLARKFVAVVKNG